MRLLFRYIVTVFALAVGVQVFAQASSVTIEDYGRLPDFETAVVSDDGSHIAMLVTVEGKRLVLVRNGDQFVKKLTVGDEKVRDLSWAGNSHLLIETSQTEKLTNFNVDQAEFSRMLVVPISNAPVETVFAKQNKIFNSVFGVYGVRVIGGVPYLFAGGIPLEEDIHAPIKTYVFVGGKPQLFKINLANMKVERVDSDGFSDDRRRWLIDKNGTIAARLDLKKNSGQYKITNQNGKVIAEGTRPDGRVGLSALGRSGASVIYWTSDADEARDFFTEVPLAGGEAKELLADVHIDRLFRDRATGRLIGYLNGDAKPNDPDRRVFFDPATNAQISKVAKAFPNLNNRLEDWSNDFGRVIVRTDGNRDSGSWFNVDLKNLSASALGYERLAITPDHVGKISTISYAAGDGLEVEAILTLPPRERGEKPARDCPAARRADIAGQTRIRLVGTGLCTTGLCCAATQFPRLDQSWAFLYPGRLWRMGPQDADRFVRRPGPPG